MQVNKCKWCGMSIPAGSTFCGKTCFGEYCQDLVGVEKMPALTKDDITDDGYIALVKAIVAQASNDVVTLSPETGFRIDAERFFQSSYFEMLTGLDGKAILEKLRAEYKERRRKKGFDDE